MTIQSDLSVFYFFLSSVKHKHIAMGGLLMLINIFSSSLSRSVLSRRTNSIHSIFFNLYLLGESSLYQSEKIIQGVFLGSRKTCMAEEILWLFSLDPISGWQELRNSISCSDIILRNDFCKMRTNRS